ncbi:hypothetical protein [Clostridium hydrogeniformans]|uniref:hypothetical protein n=1 Tax=Clostridium hydrogeniformans TaxID=349933 RepID=UPI00068DFF24|nr:hypothetical protein [Clostridium hydrogeniformans]
MYNSIVKRLLKCGLFGLLWFIILVILALLIVNFTKYNFNDVLFVEGMILVVIGVLSSLGGNPMGLSLQSLGQMNSQYVANANLEVSKREKSRASLKTTLSISLSMAAFVIGGLISILASFIF